MAKSKSWNVKVYPEFYGGRQGFFVKLSGELPIFVADESMANRIAALLRRRGPGAMNTVQDLLSRRKRAFERDSVRTYEFDVYDSADEDQGYWGSMRVKARDQSSARTKIERRLDREEVEPNGSLLPNYTLILRSA